MFYFTSGDLLKSDADVLVNTVNCEGYMGKGIAYQFKLQFPNNNADYVKQCQKGNLRPGRLHYFVEGGKTIINFPTKDKWREKSKMEYIEAGLDELVDLIYDLEIKSIAIPPLGSGNGGLMWPDVKDLIVEKLRGLSESIDIFIYEPSKNYSKMPMSEPNLSTSALVLMEIKLRLNKFDKFRLQKAAYFSDLFYGQNFFNFTAHKYGPYDHSIEVVSKGIKEFQKYYQTISTEEAKAILYNKLISNSVESKLKDILPAIEQGCSFVNRFSSDHELECLSTICFLIEKSSGLSADGIIQQFRDWSEEKSKRFPDGDILAGIETLKQMGIIEETIVGFNLVA